MLKYVNRYARNVRIKQERYRNFTPAQKKDPQKLSSIQVSPQTILRVPPFEGQHPRSS